MTSVAIKSSCCLHSCQHRPKQTHAKLNMIDRHHVDSLLAVYSLLPFTEAQQRQHSYNTVAG